MVDGCGFREYIPEEAYGQRYAKVEISPGVLLLFL